MKRTVFRFILCGALLVSFLISVLPGNIALANPDTETLRPNATGSETDIESVTGAATHWEAVDEAVADGLTSYVAESRAVYHRDLYALPASGVGEGSINSVTVYGVCYAPVADRLYKTSIRTNNVTYDGAAVSSGATWETISTEYIDNPQTLTTWTWAEIDALEAGANLKGSAGNIARCTQVYVVVDYTAMSAPTVTTSAATNVAETTATLNGNVTATGGENPTVTVYWGDNNGGTTPGNWDSNSIPTSPSQPQGVAAFYKNATGLIGGTTYYFSAKATNSGGTGWGTTKSFVFLVAPTITTNAATYVAKTTARLNSTVTNDGGQPCDVRFGYGTTTQTAANFELYDTKTAWVENTYTTGQHPYVDIASLVANTGYFYRAQIRNDNSTVTSTTEIQFTTEASFAAPTNFKAFPTATTIGLTWTKGVGATDTMIRYSEIGYPADQTKGTQAYLGPLASYTITGLTAGHTYYIVAISKSGADYSATIEVLATTTAGAAAEDEPTAPTMPTGWFQSPDHIGLSGLPLYNQMNDLFDAYDIPPASGWFFSAILVCVILGAIVFVISRHPTPAVITLAVSLAIASLIKLLPLYMMAFSALFIIGVWQLGRES